MKDKCMCQVQTAHTIIIINPLVIIIIINIIITPIQPERLSVGTLASRPATAARVPWSFPALLVVDDRPRGEGASITARTGDAHTRATRVVWAVQHTRLETFLHIVFRRHRSLCAVRTSAGGGRAAVPTGASQTTAQEVATLCDRGSISTSASCWTNSCSTRVQIPVDQLL